MLDVGCAPFCASIPDVLYGHTAVVWQPQAMHPVMLSCCVCMQMQAQEAEDRAEAVEAAVEVDPAPSPVKLYVCSLLTAVLSFAVVSGILAAPSRHCIAAPAILAVYVV